VHLLPKQNRESYNSLQGWPSGTSSHHPKQKQKERQRNKQKKYINIKLDPTKWQSVCHCLYHLSLNSLQQPQWLSWAPPPPPLASFPPSHSLPLLAPSSHSHPLLPNSNACAPLLVFRTSFSIRFSLSL